MAFLEPEEKSEKNGAVVHWHNERKAKILKTHPEVKALFGHEEKTKFIGVVLWTSQVTSCLYSSYMLSGWSYFLSAYFVGATLFQASFLLCHELTHNLGFKSTLANRSYAWFITTPGIVAYAEPFRFYHIAHHVHTTQEDEDTDIPSRFEGRMTSSGGRMRRIPTKLLWLSVNLLAYVLRPLSLKRMPYNKYLFANQVVQLCFNILLYAIFGWEPFRYFLLAALLAGGLHPTAAHFLAEHYAFPWIPKGQETASYYGPFNLLTWNAGMHVEHHDFMSIPWSRLAELRDIAPEFYEPLGKHTSYLKVLYTFVVDNRMSCFSRIKRRSKSVD